MSAPVLRAGTGTGTTLGRAIAMSVCLLVCAACAACSSVDCEPSLSPAVRAARRAVEADDVHFLSLGEPPVTSDAEFGVPVWSLGAYRQELSDFVWEYNREVRRLLRARSQPPVRGQFVAGS